jgi:hypothetical protein
MKRAVIMKRVIIMNRAEEGKTRSVLRVAVEQAIKETAAEGMARYAANVLMKANPVQHGAEKSEEGKR